MKSQVTLQEQQQYWNFVVECMCTFLGYSKRKAQREAFAFRTSLLEKCRRAGCVEDLVYHEEPYQIACDVAGKDVDQNNWADYLKLKQGSLNRLDRKARLKQISKKSTAGNIVVAAKRTSRKIAR